MVRKRFGVATAVIGLLVAGQGCSALIAYQTYSESIGSIRDFPLGSTRQEVQAKLGNPVSSRALPDGGGIDTYEFLVRNPEWGPRQALGLAVMSAGGSGLAEPLLVPWMLYERRKARRTATLTYAPDGYLLDYGPPPPYGLADDAVEGPSHRNIREMCRSEHPVERRDVVAGVPAQPLPFPDYPYHECVVRRLAIWGIE